MMAFNKSNKVKWLLLLCLVYIALHTSLVAANGGPHGDYDSDTDLCALCHRTHTAVSDALLLSPFNGNSFCLTCHDGTGAAAVPVVSTHANIDFDKRVEGRFALSCTQCHNPHGDYENLFTIREFIYPQIDSMITSGPVVFTSTSGLGSFDDGSSEGICILCHTSHSLINHDGGANHTGEINFEGTNCMVCHPHSIDNKQNTEDGFMPVGKCSGCHSFPMGARRQIVGTDGDFSLSSHHIKGEPTDEDCIVCHSNGNHGEGIVILKNVDSGENIILYEDPMIIQAEAEKLEGFCLGCHENNTDGSFPFSDMVLPPKIDRELWESGSHRNNTTTCYNCHNNGHGSNKTKLLGPWNASSDSSLPDDPNRLEEGFCYLCHGSNGMATTNIEDEFNSLSRHNISLSDQTDGSKLECINCHNPHQVNSAYKLTNPNSIELLWYGTKTDFCLTCHDGTPPFSVGFPPTSPGTGYNKSAFLGTTHESESNGSNDCQNCHYAHGTPPNNPEYPTLLKDQFSLMDNYDYPPVGQGSHFDLCWNCHDESLILNKNNTVNNFEKKHDNHVLGRGGTSCLTCHDVHAPYDWNEPGLINFEFSVNSPNYDISWIDVELSPEENARNSFWIDPITNRGNCTIACHQFNHIDLDYTRLDPYPIE